MTDTTDHEAVERLAPERIWAWKTSDEFGSVHGWNESPGSNRSEYVLKSHADAQLQAAVAEMRDRCADMVEREGHSLHVALRYTPAPTDALDLAIEAEREACAKVAEEFSRCMDKATIVAEDAALRARSDKGVA